MKFPLPLRYRASTIASSRIEDRIEKLLAESLRLLSQLCAKMADLIESEFGTRRRDDVPPDLSPEGASTASASRRVAAKV